MKQKQQIIVLVVLVVVAALVWGLRVAQSDAQRQ